LKKISCDVIIEKKVYHKVVVVFLNEQARCQKRKTNTYMFLWTNKL